MVCWLYLLSHPGKAKVEFKCQTPIENNIF